MRQMQLDFDKLNLFKFEKFYHMQHTAFQKQYDSNQSQSNFEINE